MAYNRKIRTVAHRIGVVLGGIPLALSALGLLFTILSGRIFTDNLRYDTPAIITFAVISVFLYGISIGVGWIISGIKGDA